MKDAVLDSIVPRKEHKRTPLHALMAHRITNILLVSSMYDSYTFEEDGALSEVLFAEYHSLNLSYAPSVERVSTGTEALKMLKSGKFDLVIAMLRVGGMDVLDFARKVHKIAPEVPVVLLAHNTRELGMFETAKRSKHVHRLFVWMGDHRLFFAIVKHIEDEYNVEADIKLAGVQVIILVEDSVRFYSAYLPVLYTAVVKHTQRLTSDAVHRTQRLLRMRARPKILLATTYEEGEEYYRKYRDHVLGVILDMAFPKGGRKNRQAGLDFARMVKEENPDLPVMIQSSDPANAAFAHSIGAVFLDKNSPSLFSDVSKFMEEHLGFGAFVFRRPDRSVVTTVRDLAGLSEAIRWVPDESLLYHASRNDFSAWLMARTEFELAYALRPWQVTQFESVNALRARLLDSLITHQTKTLAGVVADFSSDAIESSNMFVKIGTGSLGGKGRGLAFLNSLLDNYEIAEHIPKMKIQVPPTAVLATGVFDQFLEMSNLLPYVLGNVSDDEVRSAFLSSPMPDTIERDLRAFLDKVRYPLAVRSSSLLEDAYSQPFAGVYRTFMLPNNNPDLDVRLEELIRAIKLVYASTFSADARSYIESTPNRLEEEKMAVVIQQLVGRTYGRYHYPNISGIVRSRNFYPLEGMTPEDGIALVALGLGNMIMEGGRCVRFSPSHPERLYQFSTTEDYLNNSQREVVALDLKLSAADGRRSPGTPDESYANLAFLPLEVVEEHGTLGPVGSVFSPDNDAIYDGISRPGIRLVTMAGVLKHKIAPLAETLKFLIKVGEAGFSAPVEIEFAINLANGSNPIHEFNLLQIRQIGTVPELHDMVIGKVDLEEAICISPRALGHGLITGIRDVVYVREDRFDRSKTVEIARHIGIINRQLRAAQRKYVLIGQGRWGSADPWLGIPVTWSQISEARCIVETDFKDMRVEPSQGTHFFHNITSLGIGYFTINFRRGGGFLDMKFLDSCPAEAQTEFVRHVAFREPLEIAVDSRSGGLGVVMKPGRRITRRARKL